MDAVIKKELLERVLFLNETTGALIDQPHLIRIEEIEKREKFLKVIRIVIALLLLGLFTVYLAGRFFENKYFSSLFSEYWRLLLFIAAILISRFFTLTVKLLKVSEQKFLVKLLNENLHSG